MRGTMQRSQLKHPVCISRYISVTALRAPHAQQRADSGDSSVLAEGIDSICIKHQPFYGMIPL